MTTFEATQWSCPLSMCGYEQGTTACHSCLQTYRQHLFNTKFFSGGLWPAWNMWDSRRGDREGTINWNVACKLVIEDFALPQYSTPIFEWSENPPPLPGYGIKTRHIFVIQDKEHVLKSAVWAKLFYAILSTNTLDMGIRLGISDDTLFYNKLLSQRTAKCFIFIWA